jgi:ribosomal-protein-alanine N-acetyltransferase
MERHMAADAQRQHSEATIRAFRPADAAAVTGIVVEASEAANWTRESYIEALTWPGIVAMVHEDEGKVTGFIIGRWAADEGEILNLAVKRARRRRGEGGVLLKAALDEFRLRGVRRAFLEVRESNEAGIAFYDKHGFSKTGRRAGYYRDRDEAAIVMEMNLGD